MKHCDKCDMSVQGSDRLCPLCQNRLTGEDGPAAFPVLPTAFTQHKLFFRLLLFLSASVGVICVTVNLMIPSSGRWSLYSVLGLACFWISLTIALKKRRNLFKNITEQVVVLSLLGVLWDFLTGWNGWSLDYFIPITCAAGLVLLGTLSRIKRMPAEEYIVYLIADIFFGLIPVIFYLLGWLTVAIPSLICMALSLITLVALIVLEGRNMLQEITRRFHF